MQGFLRLSAVWALCLLCACGGSNDQGGGTGTNPPPPPPPPSGTPPLVLQDFQQAAVIIGQATGQGGMADGGIGSTTAWGLSIPRGRAAEGSLYVPDGNNNRVMGYDVVPALNGAAASFILGQPSPSGNLPSTSISTFTSPFEVVVAGGRLFVCDSGNNRVLIWNTLPTTSNAPADVVVGQADFLANGSGVAANRLTSPWSIAVGGDKLVVCDTGSARVLIWNSIPTTNDVAADVVVGQTDFTSAGPGLAADKIFVNALNVCSDGTRLVVADTSNNRVLIWNTIPTTNGVPADVVVGQPDFTSDVTGAGPQGLNLPQGVWCTSSQLFVSDNANHRVLVFEPFPSSNNPAASRVLGQSDLNGKTANDANQDNIEDAQPSSRTLKAPTGVLRIGDQLFVTDTGNHRVVIYDGM